MEEKVTQPTSAHSQRSENVLQRFLRGLLRLILVVLIGSVLGAACYFGFLYVYRGKIINPANDNMVQIHQLETKQVQAQTRIDERLSQFSERLTELESQQAQVGEVISEIQINVQDLDAVLEEQTIILDHLADLETSIDELGTTIEELETTDERLSQAIIQNSENIALVQITLAVTESSADSEGAEVLSVLKREVQVLHAMELLNRSRLYLIQNNLGFAEQDLQFARDVLLQLYADAPVFQQEVVTGWIQRLDMVIANLPELPVLASNDLEIVWQMMAAGLPDEQGKYSMFTPAELLTSVPLDPTGTPTPAILNITATPTP
ncbi:MAG: hypothetical protein MUO76_14700 [Anaerolineaceae bacterium]|nr:hypothetical protein [Anaerolineaceae bacterium]